MPRRLLPLLLLLLFAGGASDFPPIPPLPASQWPSSADAEPFARALLDRVAPAVVAKKLIAEPDSLPGILRNLGTALVSSDADLRARLGRYAGAVARAAAAQTDNVQQLAAIVIVDPLRYSDDAGFRQRINAIMPASVAGMPHAAAVLDELDRSAGLDFDTSEAMAAAAHLAPHRSGELRMAFDRAKLSFPDDLAGPIAASIYSLSSSFFTPAEAKAFLAAVHRASPKRRLIVLADREIGKAIEGEGIEWLDTHARPFTPWPRDPFIVARGADRSVVFINRPILQPQREEDANMVRALVDQMPERARWTVAPLPFHNGHILLTPTEVWISIHSVEPRALKILGLDRVPAETFSEPAGVTRYVGAVQRAANELRDFDRKPVRFVHALPTDGSPEIMHRLGDGANFDLDTIVTILPNGNALVGDLALGARLARAATLDEWAAVRNAYHLRDEPKDLRERIAAAQGIPLQNFLDQIAADLRRGGLTVRRLPLLTVPSSFVARDDVPADFLLTWNNVVLEKRGAVRRAEGFA